MSSDSPVYSNPQCRRLSEAVKWRIIGLHGVGFSFKKIVRRTGHQYSTISRLVRKHAQALLKVVRRHPFATSTTLKRLWLPRQQFSTQTVRNCLKAAGLKSRRVIERPKLTDNHKRLRLARRRLRLNWNEVLEKSSLVGRKQVPSACCGWQSESMEASWNSLYCKEHHANCTLWRWICYGLSMLLI